MWNWGLLVAATTLGSLVGLCGAAAVIGGALVGLIFRGAATAWREERDAAVDKADRLEQTVNDQTMMIVELQRKVGDLEKRTDYDTYAERGSREHKQIVEAIGELTRGLNANTTAVEFLLKQVFPTAVIPTLRPEAA